MFFTINHSFCPVFSRQDVDHDGVDGEEEGDEHGQHWKIQQSLYTYPETQGIFFTVALSVLFLGLEWEQSGTSGGNMRDLENVDKEGVLCPSVQLFAVLALCHFKTS